MSYGNFQLDGNLECETLVGNFYRGGALRNF